MTAQLKTSAQGQTLILTISNPEMRNALGPEIYAAGIEALNAAETNPDAIRRMLVEQVTGVVRWREVLQLLMEKGYDRYLNYEAPNPALWSRPPAEVAREGVTAIRALLADAARK